MEEHSDPTGMGETNSGSFFLSLTCAFISVKLPVPLKTLPSRSMAADGIYFTLSEA